MKYLKKFESSISKSIKGDLEFPREELRKIIKGINIDEINDVLLDLEDDGFWTFVNKYRDNDALTIIISKSKEIFQQFSDGSANEEDTFKLPAVIDAVKHTVNILSETGLKPKILYNTIRKRKFTSNKRILDSVKNTKDLPIDAGYFYISILINDDSLDISNRVYDKDMSESISDELSTDDIQDIFIDLMDEGFEYIDFDENSTWTKGREYFFEFKKNLSHHSIDTLDVGGFGDLDTIEKNLNYFHILRECKSRINSMGYEIGFEFETAIQNTSDNHIIIICHMKKKKV
jgi:hypothetical protein